MFKIKNPYPLDDPRATVFHRDIILSKGFLKKLYEEWYGAFLDSVDFSKGKVIEIGSGGGFLKQMDSRVVTSDILELPDCDLCFPAEKMPFENNSISGIFMLNVLHHIPDSGAFFKEAQNKLVSGGSIFMVEPASTFFSQLIYRNLHHEPFDTKMKNWSFPSKGPLSDANGALPWIIFKRDFQKFQEEYPELKLQSFVNHTPVRYLITGGLSYNIPIPTWSFKAVSGIEKIFSFMKNSFGMFVTIKVTKS